MKFFGTDFSLKHITFEANGKTYVVAFRDSFLRGVYDVSVYRGSGGIHFIDDVNAKIKDTYPSIRARIGELVSLAKHWIKHRNYNGK